MPDAWLTCLAGLAALFRESVDHLPATEKALQLIIETIGWDVAGFWISVKDGTELHCLTLRTRGNPAEFSRQSIVRALRPEADAVGHVWATGEPLWIPDLSEQPSYLPPAGTFEGLRTAVIYPMVVGGNTLGILELFSRTHEERNEGLLQFVATAATQVGLLIAREIAEQQYHALFEAALDGVAVIDEQGRIRDLNGRFAELFGHRRDALLGRPVEVLIPEQARAAHETERSRYAANPVIRPMGSGLELYGRRSDGTEFPVEISLSPVDTVHTRRTLATVRDVTIQRDLQRRSLQAPKMEAIGRLAGGIAHDFNNQLTAILGYAEMVLQQIDASKPIWEDLQEIRSAASRSQALTGQLLAFSRQQHLTTEPVILDTVVRDLERMLKPLIGEDVSMALRLSAGQQPVKVDRTQLEQILMNLVINARDAMPKGGQVLIATMEVDVDDTYAALHVPMKPGSYVALTVTDTGHGIDAGTLARVFEPFFTTKETGKGTGLGLATVYGIVKQMGGFVWVNSVPEQGTTFTIHFPVTSEQPNVKPSGTSRATVTDIGKERILVIEDEAGVRSLVARVLVRHGYRVLVAASPTEALGLIATANPFDLVLTDVVMPEMSGPELVRSLQLPAMTKVRYMSGYSDPQRSEQVPEPGTLLLEKPFTAAQLLRHVREALDIEVVPDH